MPTLKNGRLTVQILDPDEDRARLGSRYCTGGYIWQVLDAAGAPLLTGPQWPEARPDVFHGQGAPEAFNSYPGAEEVPEGGPVLVIGVGSVRRTSAEQPFQPRHNREVIQFLDWKVETASDTVSMRAEHVFGRWRYRLQKRTFLSGSTVRSATVLSNVGETVLPARWFAHPFFPIPGQARLFRANLPLGVPESLGFTMDSDE